MPIPTIYWENDKVKLIDQTKLPLELKYLYIDDYHQLCHAIRTLQVRGAPAIGIASAFAVVLGLQKINNLSTNNFILEGHRIIAEIANTRPTAINLFWALDRMKKVLQTHKHETVAQINQLLLEEALTIYEEDKSICRAIGKHGAFLIKDNFTVLTHCNAGALATADFGTALGVIYTAIEQGKNIRVFVDETRPLLQGARLTTWELMQAKIDVTLICDNAAAFVMQQGKIDCILVGADRIAANGDAANKIGTYNLAVLSNYHHIPFYIVAPTSTIDSATHNGKQIPIEERPAEEVTSGFSQRIAPHGVEVYSPAFDITPHNLITSIITEYGVIQPPYRKNLEKIQNNT